MINSIHFIKNVSSSIFSMKTSFEKKVFDKIEYSDIKMLRNS